MRDPRPLIAWDVDDVLNDLTRCWFGRDAAAFPGRTFDELRENPPDRILGIGRDVFLTGLDRYREEGYAALRPRPEVLEFLARHGGEFRHMAVTAVPRRFADRSAAWVMTHFGDWIRSFCFVPSPRADRPVPSYGEEKGDFLDGLPGRVILVDDSPRNLESALAAGCDALPFPAPWNEARNREIGWVLNELLKWKSAE